MSCPITVSVPEVIGAFRRFMNQSAVIKLSDNRRLCYAEFGDPAGEPIFLFHDSPGSRLFWSSLPGSPFCKGLRFIALDRPGWGLTDFSRTGALENWADDMQELAHWLALDKCSVLGYGAGGAFALACAWKRPESLRAVAIVDSWGPGGSINGALKIVGKFVNRSIRLLPGIIRRPLGNLTLRAKHDPEIYIRTLGFRLRGRDRELLNEPGLRENLKRSIPEGYRQGGFAELYDSQLIAGWPIPLSEINCPVHIWFGGNESGRKQNGELLADQIPGAIVHYVETVGQFWIVEHLTEVLSEMLSL